MTEHSPTVDEIKEVLFGSIHGIAFMSDRRNECFQMMGRFDGAMSNECKELCRRHYHIWDALLKEATPEAP